MIEFLRQIRWQDLVDIILVSIIIYRLAPYHQGYKSGAYADRAGSPAHGISAFEVF